MWDTWLRNSIIARSLELVPRRATLERSPIPGHTDLMWDDWKRLHGCPIDGYPDLREEFCGALPKLFESLSDTKPEDDGRYVYFVRGGDLVKIGETLHPRNRFTQLKIGAPTPLEFLFAWFIPSTWARGRDIERELHKRFDGEWSHGEWFRLSDAQISLCRDSLDGALEG